MSIPSSGSCRAMCARKLLLFLRPCGIGGEAGRIAPRLMPRHTAPRVGKRKVSSTGARNKTSSNAAPHTVDTISRQWDRTQRSRVVRGLPSKAMQFRVVTLNLEQDHKRWSDRHPLISAEIAGLRPDVVAFNEVCVPLQTARLL